MKKLQRWSIPAHSTPSPGNPDWLTLLTRLREDIGHWLLAEILEGKLLAPIFLSHREKSSELETGFQKLLKINTLLESLPILEDIHLKDLPAMIQWIPMVVCKKWDKSYSCLRRQLL